MITSVRTSSSGLAHPPSPRGEAGGRHASCFLDYQRLRQWKHWCNVRSGAPSNPAKVRRTASVRRRNLDPGHPSPPVIATAGAPPRKRGFARNRTRFAGSKFARRPEGLPDRFAPPRDREATQLNLNLFHRPADVGWPCAALGTRAFLLRSSPEKNKVPLQFVQIGNVVVEQLSATGIMLT